MLRMQLCKKDLHHNHPNSIILTTINNMLLVLTAKQQANKLSIKDMQKPKKHILHIILSAWSWQTRECDVDPGPEVGEVGVVGPVRHAPVQPQPEQHCDHGQAEQEHQHLQQQEHHPLPAVGLHLAPCRHDQSLICSHYTPHTN